MELGGRRMTIPVLNTNVASVVGWDAAAVDDDSEDDEAGTCQDLDDANDEFDLYSCQLTCILPT